jgi:phosphoribosylanthranilate isomerase
MILVKICGITNWPDAKAACDAGANLLGFNFYEKSLRRVSTVEAATMRAKLPKDVESVGIFVNAKPSEITSLHAFVRFNAAQPASISWRRNARHRFGDCPHCPRHQGVSRRSRFSGCYAGQISRCVRIPD